MDRNYFIDNWTWTAGVALRKESVDRNQSANNGGGVPSMSLSARRAWIEINTPVDIGSDGGSRSPQGERG